MKFDAQTLAILQTWTLPGAADFVQVIGNMAITGGNEGASRCSVIPIAQAPDTTGPGVGFMSPAAGTQGVAPTSRVGMIMTDQIDVTSLTAATFIVRPQRLHELDRATRCRPGSSR